MRPTYETEDDLRNERVIAAKLETAWRCKLHKLAKYSPVDYAALRDDRIVGFVEIRVKNYTYQEVVDFGDILIDVAKITKFRELLYSTNTETILVIGLKDRIIYCQRPAAYKISIRVRNDEGSEIDKVLIAHILINNFKQLKEKIAFKNAAKR